MSALSTKLIADYSEQANKYLDSIQIKKIGDFEKVKEALKALAENTTAPTQLKNRIAPLREYFENPTDWVKQEDAGEFKSLVRARIIAKIKEISSFTEDEKLSYMAEQQKQREITSATRQKLQEAVKTTTNAQPNTLSFEEWLQEEQARFSENTHPGNFPPLGNSSQPSPRPLTILEQMERVIDGRVSQLRFNVFHNRDIEIPQDFDEVYSRFNPQLELNFPSVNSFAGIISSGMATLNIIDFLVPITPDQSDGEVEEQVELVVEVEEQVELVVEVEEQVEQQEPYAA